MCLILIPAYMVKCGVVIAEQQGKFQPSFLRLVKGIILGHCERERIRIKEEWKT